MERQPCSMIGVSKSGRVSYRTTEKLEADYEVNRRSIEEYEKAV